MAVQACEAATASISRPSSPRDTLPPPVPIKEMECRARLEDLIDQVRIIAVNCLDNVLIYCKLNSLTSLDNRNYTLLRLILTEEENSL